MAHMRLRIELVFSFWWNISFLLLFFFDLVARFMDSLFLYNSFESGWQAWSNSSVLASHLFAEILRVITRLSSRILFAFIFAGFFLPGSGKCSYIVPMKEMSWSAHSPVNIIRGISIESSKDSHLFIGSME